MVSMRALGCLVTIVERGSLTKAAVLHMSQPALSHQIAAIEREVGTPVIERLPRGIRPTAAGLAAAAEARIALAAADRAIIAGRRAGVGAVLSLLTTVSTAVRWAMNNGVWAFAASSYADLIRKTTDYTLDGIADQITAPALVMAGENDQFLKGEPQKVHQALTSADATLVTLTSAEGAGEHTHAGALGRAHQIMFDWLDTTLTG